jgi:ABC-type transporter Mla subunit MlaD
VIGILNRQRTQLASLVDSTNTIAAEAASHTGALQSFLDRSASVTSLIAAHKDSLSTAINRLPGMLAAAEPALQQLDTVAVNGTPLVQQLHASVPTLNKVSTDLVPFAKAAKPGLARLTTALKQAIPALNHTTPLLKTLRTYIGKSKPSTILMGKLFKSLQRTGFAENLMSVFYYTTAGTARYDSISHILPAYLMNPNGGACGTFATTPVPGCSAHYGTGAVYTPSKRAAKHDRRTRAANAPAPAAVAPAAAQAAPAPTPAPTNGNPVTGTIEQAKQLAKQVITKLLQGAGTVTGTELQQLQQVLQGSQPPSADTLQSLTNYLLK